MRLANARLVLLFVSHLGREREIFAVSYFSPYYLINLGEKRIWDFLFSYL